MSERARSTLIALVRTIELGVDARKPLTLTRLSLGYVQFGRRSPLVMLMCCLGAEHNQRVSRKASSRSPGWNRPGVGLGSSSRRRTASLAARSASRYW